MSNNSPDNTKKEEILNNQSANSYIKNLPHEAKGENFNPKIRAQYANEPDYIHSTRPLEPVSFKINEELQRKHEIAKKLYPNLNLSDGEYVILDVRRHPMGIISHILSGLVVVAIFFIILLLYPTIKHPSHTMSDSIVTFSSLEDTSTYLLPDINIVIIVFLLIIAGVFSFMALGIWVYLQNKFYLTNECVTQTIQHSIFSKREQTVSLGSIEDASYKRDGLIESIFDYGTIRLSTEGQETTYQFNYVSNPKRQVAILNNAIESFKNGRAVNGSEGNIDYS